MNHEDLFEAIGAADEGLLEKSEKRYSRKKVFFAAVAACLVLALTVATLWPQGAVSPRRLIAPERISWSVYSDYQIAEEDVETGYLMIADANAKQFAGTMSIEAKVVEVLPDLYSIPGTRISLGDCHILRLQVLDEIVASNMPEEIYYYLPQRLDADLTQYDSLILNLRQLGLENYLVINENKRQVELFSLLFGMDAYAPENGAVMAFTDGKLDLSLWDKEGWDECRDWIIRSATSEQGIYPGNVNRSIEETKTFILQQAERSITEGNYWFQTEAVTNDIFDWWEAKRVLRYVKPFKNGVFSQRTTIDFSVSNPEYSGVDVMYTRMIDGFGTNETYRILCSYDKSFREVTESGVRFTEQDLENLPDLVSVVQDWKSYLPEKYQGNAAENHFCGVGGTYYKMEDGIWGVVFIYWGEPYEDPKGPPGCCIIMRKSESVKILVSPDGTSRIAEDGELERFSETVWPQKIIGEVTNKRS